MKLNHFLITVMLAVPSLSFAATIKGKIIRNMTDHPFSAFTIHVESNVDGGGSETPATVNNDGTFKIKTSSFWRQNISLKIKGKAFLHLTSNGDDAKDKLKSISVVQLNSYDGEITVTSGEETEAWMKKNLPYGKLELDLFAKNAKFKSSFDGAFGNVTRNGKFTIPEYYAVFTSEESFNTPVDLYLDLNTAELGPSSSLKEPLKTLRYNGLIHRDIFSAFTTAEISQDNVNTDVTGLWEGNLNAGRPYAYDMAMDLNCNDGNLSGTVTSSAQEATILRGKCNGQDASFDIAMPLENSSETKLVTFKFDFVSKVGSAMTMFVDGKSTGTGYFARK